MPYILNKGKKDLELTNPRLNDGPYYSEAGEVFEVSSRDWSFLRDGNALLFEEVAMPADFYDKKHDVKHEEPTVEPAAEPEAVDVNELLSAEAQPEQKAEKPKAKSAKGKAKK